MPTAIFFALTVEKRSRILEASIAEFSVHGYTDGSTNRIVRNAGISKGSLFQYFQNKEELYFYTLDCVTRELTEHLAQRTPALPKEIFERVLGYADAEFAWYIRNPDKCRLITAAFSGTDPAVSQQVEVRYCLREQEILNDLLDTSDISALRGDKKIAFAILNWFLKGFQNDFLSRLQLREDTDLDRLRQEYAAGLTAHMELLKQGLFTGKEAGRKDVL